MDDGQSISPLPPRLVDATWLSAYLDDPLVIPVQVGEDSAAYYEEGHVPGAVPLAWLDELQEPDRRGVPRQPVVERLLGGKGISPAAHLVLYAGESQEAADTAYAAYAYWLLRYYRHRRVSLLDGGRRAWVAAGGRLAQDEPRRAPVAYRSPGPDDSLRLTRDALVSRSLGGSAGAAGPVIVDCRDAAEYDGSSSGTSGPHVLRDRLNGHVPGAVNVPVTELVDALTGRFRPEQDLRRHLGAQGVRPDADITLYCDVGGRSSMCWFVLRDLLGYPHVRNYEGGWAEYGSLVGAPVER